MNAGSSWSVESLQKAAMSTSFNSLFFHALGANLKPALKFVRRRLWVPKGGVPRGVSSRYGDLRGLARLRKAALRKPPHQRALSKQPGLFVQTKLGFNDHDHARNLRSTVKTVATASELLLPKSHNSLLGCLFSATSQGCFSSAAQH